MSDQIRPFKLAIAEDELVDLRRRLHTTRWPDAETPGDWSQGIPLSYMQVRRLRGKSLGLPLFDSPRPLRS